MAIKRKIRSPMETCLQIFKLKFEQSQSNRNIAVALGVSPSTVYEALTRFKAASLSWPLPDTLFPEQLEKMLFPTRGMPASGLIAPDWLYIDTELRRPGVTGNPPEKPERAILADPDKWYGGKPETMGEEEYIEFRRAIHDPETIHGMIEDYRAGFYIDKEHELIDRGV